MELIVLKNYKFSKINKQVFFYLLWQWSRGKQLMYCDMLRMLLIFYNHNITLSDVLIAY